MASLKEILTLCKADQAHKAYELSKVDLEQQLPWNEKWDGLYTI